MLPLSGLLKPIRSFVRRERQFAQNANFERLWNLYGVDPAHQLNFDELFKQQGPITLEIGFGSGEALLKRACENLEHRFIGIEVYRKGIFSLLDKIEKYNLTNVRVFEGDAVKIINQYIPDNSINFIDILFPDPWPKSRHHKRRLIQQPFADLLRQKLKLKGQLYIATDWTDYANYILRILESTTGLKNQNSSNTFAEQRPDLACTKFKKRGLALGHTIHYISFIKCF